MPKIKREQIEAHCRNVGGEHWRALFAYVTSDKGLTAICMRFYVSESTLKRRIKRYYEEFPGDI